MSQETEHPPGEPAHPIYRTSGERTGKMMIIMLGICIAGAAIFFGMWDYWISQPSPVSQMGGDDHGSAPTVELTGVEIPTTLLFIESSDFRTLAFNALPGEPDNNPSIEANVGDKIIFDIVNDGKSFHSFGVTADEEGFAGIIPGTEVATASNPLKPGESGTSEFVPFEEGIFYYICTVPGHRAQGMVGQVIVGDVEAHEPEPVVEEPEPAVTVSAPSIDVSSIASDLPPGTVSVPAGSGVPGCDENDACYIPFEIKASVGDTITWSNDDSAAHTVTSGTPSDGPDGVFDSSIFMANAEFSHTFDEAGEYDYFCIVHPWMIGKVTVE